ncbi:MAG: YqgE/AlgH family protein, partial [Propionibacteriaceae bacterium]|nr:YqgE/AlgH family protein [Propionibacteriaceae bacterium]
EPPGWRPVIGDIGLLHLDTPVEIASGGYTDLRIFAGYSGWAPGQLDEELARGAWFRMPSRDEDIFTADPTSLWRRILRRHGGTPALLSTWPKDPELN